MIHKRAYNKKFWERRASGAEDSARACVPEILRLWPGNSIVDVGCGQGHWLREFMRLGIHDVIGIDGDYVLEQGGLVIPAEKFVAHNLNERITLRRRFDLALCLEVAEHLSSRCAAGLVSALTELAPIVVFSAAIPGQGGVGHINEQWPWYWENLFAERGFASLDPLRQVLWQNPRVASWYQQNLVVFASRAERQEFVAKHENSTSPGLTLIARDTLYRLTQPGVVVRGMRRIRQMVLPRPQA
jgi:SAM-dependent methyltransferase